MHENSTTSLIHSLSELMADTRAQRSYITGTVVVVRMDGQTMLFSPHFSYVHCDLSTSPSSPDYAIIGAGLCNLVLGARLTDLTISGIP